jgi:hypothetical protein
MVYFPLASLILLLELVYVSLLLSQRQPDKAKLVI